LFGRYIHASRDYRLSDTIRKFYDIIALPNVVSAIDGIHIPLIERPGIHLTPMPNNFFIKKKYYSEIVQVVCDSKRFFWNVCIGQPGGVHDGGQFG
jgi:hypothetical protein